MLPACAGVILIQASYPVGGEMLPACAGVIPATHCSKNATAYAPRMRGGDPCP